jgi:hypothetical protein
MIKLNPSVGSIVIIGCGGVTSWLIAPLIKLLEGSDHKPKLILVDGDTIEERNLERQWFSESDIGQNKAVALINKLSEGYPVEPAVTQYFSEGANLPIEGVPLFLGCADNHAARRAILSTVDQRGGWAVIAGNEYTEAEAYYYEQSMAGTPSDPRVYYPSILTDVTGDPLAPRGCTGAAAEAAPQLVLANFSAANHLLWILYHHFVERSSAPAYAKDYMPVKTWNYGTKFITTRACDLVQERAA